MESEAGWTAASETLARAKPACEHEEALFQKQLERELPTHIHAPTSATHTQLET